MLEGFSGYSLPDDLLSGSGLRVVFSIVQSIPFVGTVALVQPVGRCLPGLGAFFERLFLIHEFLFPALLAGLARRPPGHPVAPEAHRLRRARQDRAQHRGQPAVAPVRHQVARHCSCSWRAVIFGLGGLVQINPIWVFGPYEAARSSAGTQPDWYVGWLDGALRLWPHWEFRSFGHEIANPFFPGILLPGLVFTVIYAWPWIDKRLYADYGEHNLLDRPRDKPLRTAVGVAALVFFADLTLASATDVIGNGLQISFERLIEILQYGSFIGPIVGDWSPTAPA